MTKKACLPVLHLVVIFQCAWGMHGEDATSISVVSPDSMVKHRPYPLQTNYSKALPVLHNTTTTLALPALDIITYYYVLAAAQKEFARNPEVLHKACYDNDPVKVRLLVKAGIVVDAQNERKETPLYVAALYGHHQIVQLLMHHGASVHVHNPYGCTLQHMAITWNNRAMVKMLINHGEYIGVQDRDGWTLLHTAARLGYKDIVEVLLSEIFFFPHIAPSLRNSTSTLQRLSLAALLANLTQFDEDTLKKYAIPALAYHMDVKNVLHILVDQAPLNVQQMLMKLWRKQQSEEDDNKIKLFLQAHYDRHLAKIKDALAVKSNNKQTAHDVSYQHNNYAHVVTLLDHVERAQRFSDLDPKLQDAIKDTIIKKLIIG